MIIEVLLPTLGVVSLSCASTATLSNWDAESVNAAVHRYGNSSFSPSDNFRARVRLDREQQKVQVLWRYSALANFGDPPDLGLRQEFAVSYIPTTAEFINPDRLVVAGTIGTTTLVEVWELRKPLIQATVPVGGGSPEPELAGQSRESVRLVYRKDRSQVPGIVRALIHDRAKTRAVFLRLTGSDDLFSLAWPEATGLGSLTTTLSAAQYPGLANAAYDTYFGGDHALGYVYYITTVDLLHKHPAFVFIDTNRDGTIDSTALWGAAEFQSNGLTDISQWADYAGQKPPL